MTNVLLDPIATHGRSRPQAPAITDLETGQHWSYRDLDQAVSRTANWLVERFGGASGDRVATLSRNCAQMVILQFACARAGCIFVPYNWRLSPAEIAILIEDAAPVALFADPDFEPGGWPGERHDIAELATLVSGLPDTSPTADVRRGFGEATTLLYTSGTSGRPKGVMISDENAFWGSTNFIHGNGVTWDSVFLCDMPLFHTAGLFATARTPLLAGAHLLVSSGFDAKTTLSRIADRQLGVTHYFAVPQMAQMMWNQPDFKPAMMRKLQVMATGGAPNPPAQVARFAKAKIPMSDGFGMSETCSNFGLPMGDWDLVIAKAGTCGLPYLAVEARIVDEDGNDLPDNESGELWLRGPSISKGYWNQPELTAKAFQDGWFRTGDAALRDEDGYYFIVDRKKDMYISGGENVYPAEVEAAIAEMKTVAEAAVIGLPDTKWGEVGRAYIIPVEGESVSAEDVMAHCLKRLAKFKVPKTIVIGEEIPRTASGKVQKHILKARALDGSAD